MNDYASAHELITLASASVEVTGSRILEPTVQAAYGKDIKKLIGKDGLFCF